MIQKINISTEITNILETIVNETSFLRNIPSPMLTREDFYRLKIPDYDQQKGIFEKRDGVDLLSNTYVRHRDTRRYVALLKQVCNLLDYDRCTNAKIYPPMSVLNWHTNSDLPGIRTYYTYSEKEAIFRYRDPATGEIIDDYDNIGWTVRQFTITKDNLFWHAVWSDGPRYSFGFLKSNAGN